MPKIYLGFALCVLGISTILWSSIMPVKAWVGHQLLSRSWEKSFSSGERVRPWLGADFKPVAKLTIPSLDVSRIILNSASGEAMAWSIGALNNLADFHKSTPSILAGHRDSHMAFLENIKIGDQILIQLSDGYTKTYTARNSIITDKPKITLSPDDNQRNLLVLTTCWPFKSNQKTYKRFVLIAELEQIIAS